MSRGFANKQRLDRARRRANALAARFRKDSEGATVVEFAILAIPFFLLLFAILELALLFYINSALDNAASAAARTVRVGQLQNTHSSADAQLTEFRSHICRGMKAFPGCQQRLQVTMKRSATDSFSESLAATTKDNELDCSGPREVVILRIRYKYDLILPGEATKLNNAPDGSNAHIISSTTAFRNEPFATSAGTSCGTASSDNPSA